MVCLLTEEDGEEVEADEEGSDPLEGSEDGESGEDESDEVRTVNSDITTALYPVLLSHFVSPK